MHTYIHKYLRGKRRCQRVPKTSSEFHVTATLRTRIGFVGRRQFYLRTEITRSKEPFVPPRRHVNRRVFFWCFPFKRAYAFSLVNRSVRRRSLYLQDGSHVLFEKRLTRATPYAAHRNLNIISILLLKRSRPTVGLPVSRYSARARCHSLPYPNNDRDTRFDIEVPDHFGRYVLKDTWNSVTRWRWFSGTSFGNELSENDNISTTIRLIKNAYSYNPRICDCKNLKRITCSMQNRAAAKGYVPPKHVLKERQNGY